MTTPPHDDSAESTDAGRHASYPDDERTQRALLEMSRAMDAPLDDPLESTRAEVEAIAQRIRRWREESDLTLNELARRSKVAASTIQKVETGQMVPTIAVLLKIARGLDRSPTDLVRVGSEDYHVAHLRTADRHRVNIEGRMTLERIVGDLFEPALEVWRITFEPGIGSGPGRVRFDGESLVMCELGELTVSVGDDEYVLRAGDVLHYKTTLPHAWRNDGDEPARYLIIGTLPREMRAHLHESLRREDSSD